MNQVSHIGDYLRSKVVKEISILLKQTLEIGCGAVRDMSVINMYQLDWRICVFVGVQVSTGDMSYLDKKYVVFGGMNEHFPMVVLEKTTSN